MPTMVRHATEDDLPSVMELITLLAEFDGCRDAFVATEDQLRVAFFSSPPRARVLLAIADDRAIGLATYFPTFSTFLGKPGLWLDDLFVREGHRSRGAGRALMAALAQVAKQLDCARIEWTVALTNDRGIAFYGRHGATVRHHSRCVRLGVDEIDRLSEEAGRLEWAAGASEPGPPGR